MPTSTSIERETEAASDLSREGISDRFYRFIYTTKERARRRLSRLANAAHRNEDGIEAVETIIILVVAVLILIALVKFFFPDVFDRLKDEVSNLFSESSK